MLPMILTAMGAVACIALATRSIVRRSRRTAQERLEGLVTGGAPVRAAPESDRPFRLAWSAVRLAGRLLPDAKPEQDDRSTSSARLSDRLLQAGWRRPSTLPLFVSIKLLLLFGAAAAAGLTGFWRTHDPLAAYATALAAGLGCFFLPDLYLAARTGRRRAAIDRELPDVLDLLVVCTQAGLGLDAAIDKVAESCARTCPTVAEELQLTSLESQVGRPRHEVLRNFGRRTGTEATRALAAILIQSERFGTSISQALSANAEALRISRQQKAEERAGKAAVKILFPLVVCIFPAIFVIVAGPAVLRLIETLLPVLRVR